MSDQDSAENAGEDDGPPRRAMLEVGRMGEHVALAVHGPEPDDVKIILLDEAAARNMANRLEQAVNKGWGRDLAAIHRAKAKEAGGNH